MSAPDDELGPAEPMPIFYYLILTHILLFGIGIVIGVVL